MILFILVTLGGKTQLCPDFLTYYRPWFIFTRSFSEKLLYSHWACPFWPITSITNVAKRAHNIERNNFDEKTRIKCTVGGYLLNNDIDSDLPWLRPSEVLQSVTEPRTKTGARMVWGCSELGTPLGSAVPQLLEAWQEHWTCQASLPDTTTTFSFLGAQRFASVWCWTVIEENIWQVTTSRKWLILLRKSGVVWQAGPDMENKKS